MSMSPAALEAYACDYLRARRDEAAHAALVAQARRGRPAARPVVSAAPLAPTGHGVGPGRARRSAVLDTGVGQNLLTGPLAALVRRLTAGRPPLALLRLPKK